MDKATIKIEAQTEQAQKAIEQLANKTNLLSGGFGKLTESAESLNGKGFKSTGEAIDMFHGKLSALMNPTTMVAGVIGGTLVAALNKTIDAFMGNVEANKNMIEMYGLTSDQATTLNQVSDKLGVNSERVGMSMFRLSAEIQNGGKHLKALGISIRDNDGNMKSQGDLFMEVRDKIATETSATKQAMMAKELFGREGRKILPLLRETTESMKAEADQAKELGIDVTETDLARRKAFISSKKDAEDVGLAFSNKFARPLMDALPDIINTVSNLAAKFLWVGDLLANVFRGGLTALNLFATGLDTIIGLTTVAALKIAEVGLRMTGMGKEADKVAKEADKAWAEYVKNMEGHQKSLEQMWSKDKRAENEKDINKDLTEHEKAAQEKSKAEFEKHQQSLADARVKAAKNAIDIENTAFKEIENNEKLSYDVRENAIKEHYKKLAELQQEHNSLEMAATAEKNMKGGMSQEQQGAEIVAIQNKQYSDTVTNAKAETDAIAKLEKEKTDKAKSEGDKKKANEVATMDFIGKTGIGKMKEFAKAQQLIKFGETMMGAPAAAAKAIEAFAWMGPAAPLMGAGVYAAVIAQGAEIMGAKFAKGGVFTNSVVYGPTAFNRDMMGEAGPEAIMPLTKTSSGALGVAMVGSPSSGSSTSLNVNVSGNNFHPDMNVTEFAGTISQEIYRNLRLIGKTQ